MVASSIFSLCFKELEKPNFIVFIATPPREADVGTNRAVVCYQRAAELNSYVTMRHETGALSEEMVKEHMVVLTNSSLEEQLKVNEWCRAAIPAINMIVADFGPKFTVVDTNGKQPITAMIASVTTETSAVVTTLDEARH